MDELVDRVCRVVSWDYCGLDNIAWLYLYVASSPQEKKELEIEYLKLKKEALGPYYDDYKEFNPFKENE